MSGRKNYFVTAAEVEKEIKKLTEKHKKEVSEIEKKIEKQMHDHKKTERILSEKYNELNDTFKKAEKKMAEEIADISADIKTTRKELEEKIDVVAQNIRSEINIKEENSKNLAKEYLSACNYAVDEIKRLNGSRFMPDESTEFYDFNDIINTNFQSGNYETAAATAQIQYIKSIGLRKELEIVNRIASQKTRLIEERIRLINKYVNEKEMILKYNSDSGEIKDVNVDLSFWAEENWKQFINEALKLKKFENDKKTASINEIKEYENMSEKLLNNYFDIKTEAATKHFSSIATLDKQEDIVNRLGNMGFEVVENYFEHDDERNANILLLCNASNEKIRVKIIPDGINQKIKVSFNSLNPVTHQVRMSNLNKIIGVNPTEEPGYENRPAPETDFQTTKDHERNQQKQ